MLSKYLDPTYRPQNLKEAGEYLIFLLKKHRLMFLFIAVACQSGTNPDGSSHNVVTSKEEIPGWPSSIKPEDFTGEFLFKHKDIIESYYRGVLDNFGRECEFRSNDVHHLCHLGSENPNTFNEWDMMEHSYNRPVDVESDMDFFLDRISSEEILEAVKKFRAYSVPEEIKEILARARDVAYPTWHPDGFGVWGDLVSWEYPQKLDAVIGSLETKANSLVEAASAKLPSNGTSKTEALYSRKQIADVLQVTLPQLKLMRQKLAEDKGKPLKFKKGNTIHNWDLALQIVESDYYPPPTKRNAGIDITSVKKILDNILNEAEKAYARQQERARDAKDVRREREEDD